MILTPELAQAALRIAFGTFSMARTLQLIRFRRSLWAGKLTRRTRNALLAVQMTTAILLTLGFLSFPAALVHFFAASHLTRKSWRGGETALWQGLSLYFVYAPGAAGLSLDGLTGWPVFSLLPAGSFLPECALTLFLGGLFWDAALSLKRDPFWRIGLATSRFVSDPRRVKNASLSFHGRSSRKIDRAVFAFLVAFLPVTLSNGIPMGAFFSLIVIAAGFALAGFFTMLWTGIGFILTGGALLTATLASGLAGIAWSAGAAWISTPVEARHEIAAALLALLTLIPFLRFLPAKFRTLRRVANLVASAGWGSPRRKSASALSRPSAYRSFFVGYSGDLNEAFRVFNGTGGSGKDAAVLPEYLTAMAEAIRRAEKEFLSTRTLPLELARLITAFAEDLAALSRKRLGRPPAKLIFRIADLSSPSSREEGHGLHEGNQWRDAFQVEFSGKKAVRIRKFATATST